MTVFAYSLFYIICGLNIIVGVNKKRSNVLYALSLAVIFVLMTFNCDGPDIGTYIRVYDSMGKAADLQGAFRLTYMEKGYTFLMFCSNKAGLDFYAFRAILTIVCLALFVSSVKYYKVNPNIIVGLYMAYLFFFDTIQLRNCIMQFIVLFATRYLFRKSSLSVLKYIICIAAAGSMHVLAWIFISLLLVRFVKSKKGFQIIFAAAVVIFGLCVLLQPILPNIINDIAKYLNRGSSYFHSTLRFNHWIVMALLMLGLIPMYLYKNKITDKRIKNKIVVIMRIEIITGLFLPMCFINSNFNRIFRNILLLETIGLALLYQYCPRRNKEAKTVVLAAQFLMVGGWLVTDLIRNRDVNIINTIIHYNLFFSDAVVTNIAQYIIVAVICMLVVFAIKTFFSNNKKQFKRAVRCSQSRC